MDSSWTFEAVVDVFGLVIDALVHPGLEAVDAFVLVIEAPVHPSCEAVDAFVLSIEALVNVLVLVVEALVDGLVLVVEALVDVHAQIIEAVMDRVEKEMPAAVMNKTPIPVSAVMAMPLLRIQVHISCMANPPVRGCGM